MLECVFDASVSERLAGFGRGTAYDVMIVKFQRGGGIRSPCSLLTRPHAAFYVIISNFRYGESSLTSTLVTMITRCQAPLTLLPIGPSLYCSCFLLTI